MKNLIPKPFIQDVVTRTDIVSVIESRIELKKRGSTHIACCPFHNEKTPSFTVSQSKQFYYCFGCGAHGNVIGFLIEYDHLSFVEVVTDLAQALGLAIPLESQDINTSQNDLYYSLLHNAQLLYEKQLKQAQNAINYLKNRGLTGIIAKEFGIGYAPNAWDFLLQALGKNKSDQAALTTAGMLIEKQNGHYDRFRDRIVFPIRDIRGRTIGFGGRTLTNEIPKYLNSPETPIFHKQQTLYGLYEMCQHHRNKLQRALIVEGYLDVISLAQQGICYAVATLGTAFNIKHIQLLLRHTSDIIFCFDGDNAGRKAAWKAITLSLPLLRDGINIRVLFLSPEEDPDSLVRKIGKAAFEKLIDDAETLSTVLFDELEKEFPLTTIAGKAAFGKHANEHLSTMPEGIYKNLLLDELAKRLQMAREKMPSLMTPKNNEKKAIKSSTPVLRERLNPAQTAIQLLLHQPELAKTAKIPTLTNNTHSTDYFLLFNLINRFSENLELTMSDLLDVCEDPAQRALIAAIATYPLHVPKDGMAAEFDGALQRIVEQDQEDELSLLIEKAKNNELAPEEKQHLQMLLARKNVV